MECEKCGFFGKNKKSFSNHIRNGCPVGKISDLDCKNCGCKMPKRKPSEQGSFCNRSCYFEWKVKTGSIKGINSHLYKTGESRTRIYATWLGIIRRCCKITCKDYKNYGGRGISICSEWKNDFFEFKNWATSNGYEEHLTIERINVNGNYEPSNCTWIKMSDQSKNRRNVKNNNF